ncbi:MAG: N-acetylneuraminate synthase family protein [Polyangiaceae bacterium]|nr:N-acetylneuraminate synthase family protein [Polyangiaceae bacterium]
MTKNSLPDPPRHPLFRRDDGGPFVIAEIGVNHEGDLDTAFRLIDEAARGGADAVKFQTYKASKLASKNSPSYWDLKSEPTTSQRELFSKYDGFGDAEYKALAEHAGKRDVIFCSTPFDLDAVRLLAPMMPFFKIASADITNLPLLDAVVACGKPVLLSTGASHLSEIEEANRHVRKHLPAEQVGLLQCVLEYPTPYADANIAAIGHLREIFPDQPIGYSDHTRPDPAMLVLLRSWMLGATIIEKHFTHDKTLPGNDHYHAMDESDLRRFREGVALLQSTEGSPIKQVLPAEEIARRNARRSLVASRDLPVGHVLSAVDLAVKRPAFGLPTAELPTVIGKALVTPLAEDDFLTWDHLLKQ